MAEKTKSNLPSFTPKYPNRGRLAPRLPKNIINRLQYREVFHKLPGRLGFSLRSLVHESVLREGHVFLGFSKNGQFVLSYTLHLEADDHTAYPIYVYRLQWWHFLPYKRLRKVSEIRLFGEEEIQQDLLLCVCEWPNVDTKLVIHGYGNPCDNEEKRQCYITIAAVPPIDPCHDCISIASVQSQNGLNSSSHGAPSRCLRHAFAVHSRYELAPPYPSFAPKVFLKVDGVVVVNTGDSLVVLSVQIEKNNPDGGVGGAAGAGYAYGGGGMFSPRIAPSESYPSSGGASPASTGGGGGGGQPGGSTPGSAYGGETGEEDPLLAAATAHAHLPHFTGSPPPFWCYQSSNNTTLIPTSGGVRGAGSVSSSREATAVLDHRGSITSERYNIAGKENQIVRQLGSPLSTSVVPENSSTLLPCGGSPMPSNRGGDAPSTTLRCHKSPFDVYNFEGSTPKRDEDVDSGDCYPPSTNSDCCSAAVPTNDQSTSDVNHATTGAAAAPLRCPTRSVPGYRLGSSGYRLGGARLRGGEAQTGAAAVDHNLAGFDEFQFVETAAENDERASAGGVFEKPSALLPRLQLRTDGGGIAQRLLPNLSFVSPSTELYVVGRGGWGGVGGGGNMALSPGYGRLDQGGSSTCSSCISSPIILQNESKCFTFSIRRYVETSTTASLRPESPVDVEDDLNLAYHSLLPLEVHGSNYCNMKLVTNQSYQPVTSCVAVKQLTLDVEHYLGEAVRTCAEWGHRYLAFTDYDVQILEVCPETTEVTAFVFVLIRARPPKEPHQQHTHGIRSVPKLYDTGFKLAWNLQTGSYKTLGVKELVEVNQAELLRGKPWHPGYNFHKISDALHQRCSVPSLHHQLVHVLTNEAVFKGLSLKMLLNRQFYSAILL